MNAARTIWLKIRSLWQRREVKREIDEELREMVMIGASTSEIRLKAKEKGMLTLRQSGIEKIKQGLVSIEEVLRETSKV